MMKHKTLLLTTLLCLLPLALSLSVYSQLPEQIAVHFDAAGRPDNYMPKAAAAFGLPVFFAAVNLYTHFRVNRDPRVENAASALRVLSRWTAPVLSLILMPVTLFMAMGAPFPLPKIGSIVAGAAIVICGNYLPKCKRNYTVGIKLPWTLDSEENWNRTHRFAGFLWVAGGLAILISPFVPIPYVTPAAVVLLIALPFAYSYLFYRRHAHDAD